jgi:hypothetical protein
MTAPTIKRNAAKKTLDQRAPSRHDKALVAVATGPAGLSKTITFETKALALRI